jgi:hypothetical protein
MRLLATSDAIALMSRREPVTLAASAACAIAKPMPATRAAAVNIGFIEGTRAV